MVVFRHFLVLWILFLVMGLGLAGFVRLFLKPWWQRSQVRLAAGLLVILDFLVPLSWYGLLRIGQGDAADSLVTLMLGLFFGQIALGGALVLAALLQGASRLGKSQSVVARRRKFLLQSLAVGLPVAAGAAGLGGVIESERRQVLRRLKVDIPDLPPALNGLRILHFSDVHLWDLVTLSDLERALDSIPRGDYDLDCVTGDLADDMSQLPRALEMIADLDAPLGHVACLGNHEHSRGLDKALAAYNESPVELLVTSGKLLHHNGYPFVLVGIDDLRSQRRIKQNIFYPAQLKSALGPTSPSAFSILLSHRPSVMPHAAKAGINLVLAGHTHGGQLAVAGRSILELNGTVPWAWGLYRHESTVMHVTCGLGQWFPWRLGCPPEMVILELQESQDT